MRAARLLLPLLLLLTFACGETPETTEQARGLLSGVNIVLALTLLLIVVAGGLLLGAVGLDRFARSRQALADAPPQIVEEEEETDEVVAGITVGRAGVPRWLYGFYVLIPLFAFTYVVTNVSLEGEAGAERTPAATEAPTGPRTEWTIVAQGIEFDLEMMTFPAETEVSVTFDNQDAAIPHNWAMYEEGPPAQGDLFIGETFNGVAEQTYNFTTPGAGEYYFQCDVHPAMNGTAEVVAG